MQLAVTIIIPTYNGKEHLDRCLSAIERNTIVPYKLLVADDMSSELQMRTFLRGIKSRCSIIKSRKRRGFAGINNWAVSKTDTKYICLLNSDTEPGYMWLTFMLEELDNDEDVGIVGARLLYPPQKGWSLGGSIQHAGVARNSEGLPYHIFGGQPADLPAANVRRELNGVTFACALIRRKLWAELDGLDEGYVMGQFEDIDFCLKARKNGWKIVYQPLAALLHYEHGSGEEFVSRYSLTNRSRLVRIWGNLGSDEHLFTEGEKCLSFP